MVWVRGDLRVVEALSRRPEVARIYANPQVRLPEPIGGPVMYSPMEIEWNIIKVRAPEVWAAGFEGQGVVVGGQDTGYDWDHPALKGQYRGWDGTAADHNYAWHDAIHGNNAHTPPGNPCGFDAPAPCDDHGHGTHTMGIMVGDDGGANQISMAPRARWIGCRSMEQGWGSPATYAECYQWFIAPTDLSDENPDPSRAPHIINNSWGCPPSEGCTDPDVLRTVVQNVRAAGILSVHSAGNSGPDCGTINDPAAIYDASFTVGATDVSDTIASFSSRGPVAVDGSNRLKPDVAAPGVSIRSSVPGGGYTYMSGTSMAAPHVAGLAALLISANPGLAGDVDRIEAVLNGGAVPRVAEEDCGGVSGDSVPNNTYGYGRVDAFNALEGAHTLAVEKVASAPWVRGGEQITYTLSVSHYHPYTPTTNVVLADVIPSGATFVSATVPYNFDGEVVTWESANLENTTWSVELVVEALPGVGMIVNGDYGVRSTQVPLQAGKAVEVFVDPKINYLPVMRQE